MIQGADNGRQAKAGVAGQQGQVGVGLQLKTELSSQTNYYRMEQHPKSAEYVYPLERLHLEPLSLNIPLPCNSSPPNPLEAYIKQRLPPAKSDRHNKTTTIKSLAGLKQALSRSLFNKKQRKTDLTKQKLRDDLTYFKSDSKPISPESQQKEPLKSQKLMPASEAQYFDEADNDACFSNTDEILDTKFNKILELNLNQQRDLDLDIESKFTSRKSQKSLRASSEAGPVEPCVTFAHLLEHERLLEEENGFIREQLMMFTEVIDAERVKNSELKHKSKVLNRQNSKLRQRNRIIQQQLLDKEEKCYNLTIQNQEYKIEVNALTAGKEQLMEQFEELSKEFNDILSKLQNYESTKEKEIEVILEERSREKEQFLEQLADKEKQINQLNQIIAQLQTKVSTLTCPKDTEQGNNADEQDDPDLDNPFQEKGKLRNSSICLSLAEAESLKNIIEQKELMFQREIENLKKQNLKEEVSKSKIIEDLTFRIKQYEQGMQNTSKPEKNEQSDIQQLKTTYTKRINALQHYLQEERQENQRLNEQLAMLEQQYEKNEAQQDEELEDLLQKCVNELEKERHSNYLLREEINNLKRTFAKELYYVQQIEDSVYLN